MSRMNSPPTAAEPKRADAAPSAPGPLIPWLLVALTAHTGWGIYPVLARYLQTVSGIPSMALLAVSYAPLVVVFLVYALPRYGAVFRSSRPLWIFGVVVVARSITNVLATRYTQALFVQLITLMTPFLIAFLSTLVLHESLPRITLPAMVLSGVGSLLMLSSEISAEGVRFALTRTDWIGIGLALASAIALAFYMIAVRRTVQVHLSGFVVLLFQSTVIAGTSLLLSLLAGEEWSRWQTLGGTDWLVLGIFALAIVIGANALQISALRRLGAPVVSSLMGWRLLSTLVLGILLLGEGLQSWLQAVGMAIVLATVTWYLWHERR